jgi:nucleotide-binding universal stress UspA family protein
MRKPILAGVDPLREDPAPLHLAAALGRLLDAPVVAAATVLHDPITNAVTAGTVEEELRDHAAGRLRELAGDLDAETVVAFGSSPAHALHELAAEREAVLLVVGSTRKGPIGRLTAGSTAERLLHGASCPVVVATAALPRGWAPERIGVGFIDLPEGRAALRAGLALAAAAGCSLHAVTAVEPSLPGTSAVVQPYEAAGHGEAARATARRALDKALADAERASGEVVVGSAVDALERLSGEVDLLVCGSRGYAPLQAVLLGGVTHRLTRVAHCPVVVVPRGGEDAFDGLERKQAGAAR